MAQVPATAIESTSLGDVAEFTIPFPFLSRAEVFVTVDGVSVPFTWINDGLVQLSAVPELGAVVRRYRSTAAYVPLHQFSTGVPFLPRYVDRDFKQTLYAVQESVNDTAGTAAQALATAEESLLLVQDAFDILGARTQYMVLGPYAAGLLFETTSQVFSYLGEFYAPGPGITLPYTTTGVGAAEITNFRSVGDAVLRQDLASSAVDLGASLIVGIARSVNSIAALRTLLKNVNSKDAFVTGYYTALDGGGGHYHLDIGDVTSVDNGGSVIVAADGGRWKLVHNGTISIRQFGAKPDLSFNSFPAIQATFGAGVSRVYMPGGDYRCLSTWNLCNLATTGRGLHIFGDCSAYDLGASGTATVIHSNPGAGKWVAEIVGSQFVTIEDIKFVSTGANAATYGLLYARSTLAGFAQNNSLRRVIVKLDSGGGSIALGNNCAEQFVCDECWLESDIPYVTTLANEQGFVSQYATIANTTFSNTVQGFRLTTFHPLTSTGMILTGLGTANFDNCVVIPKAGNTYQFGITLRSSLQGYQDCQRITFTGQIESWVNAIRLEGNTRDVQFDFSTSTVTGAHVLALAGTVHYSPNIRTNPLNTTGVNVIQASAASATIHGGSIVIAPNLKLVDSNLKLLGTDVDGGNAALNNPAVFAVKSDSSYHPRWANSAIYGARAWTPGDVPIGGSVAVTFTLTGAAVGDMVDVAWPFGSQSCILQGAVDSANTVRLTISNITGAIVTFAASGTFKTILSRPTF